MRRTLCNLLLAATGMACLAGDGNEATKTLDAKVRFMLPVGMKVKNDLFFGGIIVDPGRFQGGEVILWNGRRTFTGEGLGAWTIGRPESPHPAVIDITGEEGQCFKFWAVAALNLTKTGGNPITLKTIVRDLTDKNPDAGILGVAKGRVAATVEVGGALLIPAGVTPGRYWGTFEAYVQYL